MGNCRELTDCRGAAGVLDTGMANRLKGKVCVSVGRPTHLAISLVADRGGCNQQLNAAGCGVEQDS